MDVRLDEKRAFIAASSKGLGRAVATELVREGARVTISSRNEANLSDATTTILNETGASMDAVRTAQCDLRNEDNIRESITSTVEAFGGLDILVTNHGGPPAMNFQEASPADFDDAYEMVIRSTYTMVDTALPALCNGGGSVAHIVSASARESPQNHLISNSTRPGIYGISKSLSNKYAEEGIRSNCVCPRGVMTERLRYKIEDLAERRDISYEEAKQIREEELPVNRLGTPEEFGKSVAFIVSEAADFITGAIFPIDGGWSRQTF
jgi:3-oxoacyl-[acyl-carrier protein] reductase